MRNMAKFLVVSPHPDDLDFGCAGTIAKLAREGNEIEELIVTDGSKGGHVVGFDGRKLARVRKKEQKGAAKILGVKTVHFLDEIDGEVENTMRLRKKLVAMIRKIKPDIVISFEPTSCFEIVYRSHRDHRQVAEAVFDALYPAAGSISFFPELLKQGFKPHQPKELWFFGTEKPNTFVDITETINQKIEALLCHRSQVETMDLPQEIRARAGKLGKKRNFKYAEAFRMIELD